MPGTAFSGVKCAVAILFLPGFMPVNYCSNGSETSGRRGSLLQEYLKGAVLVGQIYHGAAGYGSGHIGHKPMRTGIGAVGRAQIRQINGPAADL